MDEIKAGVYKHYKGKQYEVIGSAYHSETMEEMVVYKMLYDTENFKKGTLWVRPKKMFLEKVEVNGAFVNRFDYIDSDQKER